MNALGILTSIFKKGSSKAEKEPISPFPIELTSVFSNDFLESFFQVYDRSNQDFFDFDSTLAPVLDKALIRPKAAFFECLYNLIYKKTLVGYRKLKDLPYPRSPEQDRELQLKIIDYFLSKDASYIDAKIMIHTVIDMGTLEQNKKMFAKYNFSLNEMIESITFTNVSNLEVSDYFFSQLLSLHPGPLSTMAVLHNTSSLLIQLLPTEDNSTPRSSPLVARLVEQYIGLVEIVKKLDYSALQASSLEALKKIDSNYYQNSSSHEKLIEISEKNALSFLLHLDYDKFKNLFLSSAPPPFSFTHKVDFFSKILTEVSFSRTPEDFIDVLNEGAKVLSPDDLHICLGQVYKSAMNYEMLEFVELLINRAHTPESLKGKNKNISPKSIDSILYFIKNGPYCNNTFNFDSALEYASPTLLAKVVEIGNLTNDEKASLIHICFHRESLEHYNAVKELNFFDIDNNTLFDLIKSANNLESSVNHSPELNPKNYLNEIVIDYLSRENKCEFYLEAHNKKLLDLNEPLLEFLKIQIEKKHLLSTIVPVAARSPISSFSAKINKL